MSASCLSPGTLSEFLAGQLSSAEEQAVATHLETCGRCEQLASNMSGDAAARSLALASASRRPPAVDQVELGDLCRRLYALPAYEAALQNETACPARDGDETGCRGDTAGAGSLAESAEPGPPAPPILQRLGRYEIVRVLGAGAFGIVYLARDAQLQRHVALKVARASVLNDPILRSRFFREGEAVARLDHPNIVPVYEAGDSDGQCFVALAYCDGPTLHDWLKEHPGPHDPAFAVQLLLPLVEAAEHAHSRGIFHRDIKPGNILLPAAPGGARPSQPKLTDFGLAKVVEHQSSETLAGVILGTACYMAPEQAAGHLERIGAATDVYALGTVLYELLSGRVPIFGNSTIDTLRRLLIDEPEEIRLLASRVPEDLEAIVRKCLQKSPSQRYATARDLADDLRRFLSGQPTKARPLSTAQRCLRWTRKHKTLVPLLMLAASVVALSLGLLLYAQRLSRSESAMRQAIERLGLAQEHAQSREDSLAQQAYARDVFAAGKATARGDIPSAVAALKRQIPATGESDQRGLGWHYLWALNTNQAQSFVDSGTEVYSLALAPGGKVLAAVGKDGWLRLYDAGALTLSSSIETGQIETNSVAFSRSGALAVTAGDDGTVRVFDLATRMPKLKIAAHFDKAFDAVFFDGDTKLASCGKDPVIRLWDAATGAPLATLAGHAGQVEAIDISPDERQLVSAGSDRTAMIWSLVDQAALHVLPGHRGAVKAACFSLDGKWVATGATDNTIALWDARTGKRQTTEPQLDAIESVAFSPDSQRLYVGDRSGSVHRYRITPGQRRAYLNPESFRPRWQAHAARLWQVIGGDDPSTFYTAGQDHLVRRWDPSAPTGAERVVPTSTAETFVDLEYSPDGKLLLGLSAERGITIFDAVSLRPLRTLESDHSQWRTLQLLGRRREVAAGNATGVVVVWNFDTGRLLREMRLNEEELAVNDLASSADGALLAVSSNDLDEVRLYDTATGEQTGAIPASIHFAIAVSPDGRRLALDLGDDIALFELPAQRLINRLPGHTATVRTIAFSADGQLLASGSDDRTIRLWTVEGTHLATFTGHLADVSEVRFSPDSRSLVSIDDRGLAALAHVPTRQTLFELPLLATRLQGLSISPDSRRMAVIRSLRDSQEVLIIGGQEGEP